MEPGRRSAGTGSVRPPRGSHAGPTDPGSRAGPLRTRLFAVRRFRWRRVAAIACFGLLAFSGYGLFVPTAVRCELPGAVGCPGGVLGGPLPSSNSSYEQFFNVTMYDYGFWITDTVSGANDSNSWSAFEGWTIHINATSLPPVPSAGGTGYHGFGVELNATGTLLFSVSAAVGKWTAGSFIAPTKSYHHQRVFCTVICGTGHSGMQVFVLDVIPSTLVPSVSILAEPPQGIVPFSVTLNSSVQGGTAPFSYAWDFGDGSPGATEPNTTHTFTLAGNYTVGLVVTDRAGFQGSATTNVLAVAPVPLNVTSTASVTRGVVPLSVDFTGVPVGGYPPYTLGWEFGDGGGSNASADTHLYTAAGQYSAVFSVTDAHGARASVLTSIAVLSPSANLTITAFATPAGGVAPANLSFHRTIVEGVGPYQSLWLFGDGNSSRLAAPSHLFTSPGNYTVLVFVTDFQDRQGWFAVPVAIAGTSTAPLAARIDVVPNAGGPPLPVVASVSMTGGAGAYAVPSWTFGDGQTANGTSVAHSYPFVGSYVLEVEVADGIGRTASASAVVRVEGFQVRLDLDRALGDAPFTLTVGATLLGGTGTFDPVRWDWGDGTASAGNPGEHLYGVGAVGDRLIVANVTDSGGATAQASAVVHVFAPPVANLSYTVPARAYAPVSVSFALLVTGGSGNYSSAPLWDFGDRSTTRGPASINHTYTRPGRYVVTVATNDSLGTAVNASVIVLVPGGAATAVGGTAEWSFDGVGDPNTSAFALIGVIGLSGLGMLVRRRTPKRVARAPVTPRGPPLRQPPRAPGRPKPAEEVDA